ncbi:MAG: AMP-binding protein, partial [Burkholderiaceae bacterium]|nr:AMP-binding protein [Burkholderiaceae bacterium]
MSVLWDLSRFSPRHEIVVPGDTLPQMCLHAVRQRGDAVWLRQKELGIWQSTTWREFGEIVREIALGLVALGFAPGETVSILSNTRREWVFADFGVLTAAGISNGIYPTDSPEQVEYLMTDSGSVYIFVEDEEQLDKVLTVRARLPQLRKIFVFDMEGLQRFQDPQVMSLQALRELGRRYPDPTEWERRIAIPKPEDVAVLIYT